jgi:hypothetical protein
MSRYPDITPQESCIVRHRGDTTTGLEFRGDLDWIAWCLVRLGSPADEAAVTVQEHEPEERPDGTYQCAFRVCRECDAKATPRHFRAGYIYTGFPLIVMPVVRELSDDE